MEQRKITNIEETQKLLQDNNIEFKLYEHNEAPDLNTLREVVKFEKAPYIKNLLYSEGKGYYYILAQHDTVVEKTFWKNLNLKANKMRFANEEALSNILGCKKGNVNPLSIINDHEKKITKIIIDNHLLKQEYWAVHPMDNKASVEFKREDVLKLLETYGKIVVPFDVDVAFVEPPKEDKKKKEEKKKEDKQGEKGETLLKITCKKNEDLTDWYVQVIQKAELIDYYNIQGCYILRPWAYHIWEQTQTYLNGLIRGSGIENCYFPMFVTQKALETEKEHVEGFSPEVAWVTKSGQSDLNEPIAIRPTSETIMYPAFKNWIQSHRDLPIRINQWSNVVRWEFKHPTPFIRTREFLWQEGHTAHATKKEADEQTYEALEFYRSTYEDFLAVPVIKGIKTEGEKFPGGDFTTTVETIIPENGRAIQAATSHQLGQNFAKMFDITFSDQNKEKQKIWQTSWGFTTRSIGVLIMFHGDDIGLVLPPKVAQFQVVIVPIKMKDQKKYEQQVDQAYEIAKDLKKAGIRVKVDDRENYTPGWRYAHWEVKGVPLRLELGPKDFDKQELRAVVRHNGEKFQVKWDGIGETVNKLFDQVQSDMYTKAKKKLDDNIRTATTWQEFMEHLNNRKAVFTPWCNVEACEENVKQRSGDESKQLSENEQTLTGAAKSLCMPMEQPEIKECDKCFVCDKKATKWVYWGRSY